VEKEEAFSFEMVEVWDEESERKKKRRRRRYLLTGLAFLLAAFCYGGYLASYMNAEKRRCESFAAAFDFAFSGRSVTAVDALLQTDTIVGFRGRKLSYLEARRHIRAYFQGGPGLLAGTAELEGDIIRQEKLFFSFRMSGSLAGSRGGAPSGFRAEAVMDASGVVSLYSDDPLFGQIFFGI
jgi:hypothetical protein